MLCCVFFACVARPVPVCPYGLNSLMGVFRGGQIKCIAYISALHGGGAGCARLGANERVHMHIAYMRILCLLQIRTAAAAVLCVPECECKSRSDINARTRAHVFILCMHMCVCGRCNAALCVGRFIYLHKRRAPLFTYPASPKYIYIYTYTLVQSG